MIKIKKLLTKKIIIITAIVLLAAGGVGYAYYKNRHDDTPGQEPTINYGPPTEEEKQQADDNKDQAVDRKQIDEQAKPADGSKKSVKPIITQAQELDNRININAYIPGIFEDGGTCTASLVMGSSKVTATSSGFANVSNTNCTPINIPLGQFPRSGDWNLTLDYNSGSAVGKSDSVVVKVQL